ncbi:MAG: arsenate reductase (glutaredoxin) [Flavobacterium sp. MedPE-SWcel]|uniref:arsenate reductase (glutaredoxin) n=1 Tax=uncultured Flavobacterium sp. TaxID=165435 RepID=UPI00091A8381|nr:arsenate reductase (glutaredoxin) [uncultured Flavobacterium sp.]OIQ20135.1 MAG: arsenate reductase (glutaredoxin) [Flavobacterium sp. MedPE-SWcel]
MLTIYHNPRCSKSREGLQLLESKNTPFTVVKYLNENLTKQEVTTLINKLAIKPIELVRVKEAIWKENYKGLESIDDNTIIDALVKYPKLIERPIVVNGDKAVIARPASNIESIL